MLVCARTEDEDGLIHLERACIIYWVRQRVSGAAGLRAWLLQGPMRY